MTSSDSLIVGSIPVSWVAFCVLFAASAAPSSAAAAPSAARCSSEPLSATLSTSLGDEPSEPDTLGSPLSAYETPLPHTTQPELPEFERALLVHYLDAPRSMTLVKALADLHLGQSLVSVATNHAGEAVRHSILALYFLNREKDLGERSRILDGSIAGLEAALARVFDKPVAITSDEYHDAHVFYRRVFHFNQEQDRYIALAGLLEDFAREPRNVYTSFAITAINLWIGGEADYDDPTTLYNFLLGSYFSLNTISLSHELENAWDVDPAHTTRFRMAACLGGFGLLQRRWLALVNGDDAALNLIDDEHRAWYKIQPAFHSFPLGLSLIDEPANFAEGYAVYSSGIPSCSEIPGLRTCSNLPRFQFNLLGFVLGIVDYAMKAGDLDTARSLLSFRSDPSEAEEWASWTIGRDAWLHREQNFDAIAALYAGDHPVANNPTHDNPVNFEMKRRKWGQDTTTCQECHQVEAFPDSFDVVEEAQQLPPAAVASVNNWPPVTTAWYGASLR